MKHAVVTGGAGFLGSHLCDALLAEEWRVTCVDSLDTSSLSNVEAAISEYPQVSFRFIQADVIDGLEVNDPVDWIFHLASRASPTDYATAPVHTLRTGSEGTLNALKLATRKNAGLLLASTSEVYGDPLEHPQREGYFGNVDPTGPRSCYDEAKRYAEALTTAYSARGADVRIARIFNTYGPRMRSGDGRVVPTFVRQALANQPITVHGDGLQTRSLCYVDDLIGGLIGLTTVPYPLPVNLGSDDELSMNTLAEEVRRAAGSSSEIIHVERPVGDPQTRRPDLTAAHQLLGWEPRTGLTWGLMQTVSWARNA